MPTPFPTQFILTRKSKPRILPRSRQRFLSDGSIAKNQVTSKLRYSWDCEVGGLTVDEKNTLVDFLVANEFTKDVTWPIDGVNFEGEFFGAIDVVMRGKRFDVIFTYIAHKV